MNNMTGERSVQTDSKSCILRQGPKGLEGEGAVKGPMDGSGTTGT